MNSTNRLFVSAAVMAGIGFAQIAVAPIAGWSTVIVYGKVTLEDGSAPPKTVVIQRTCSDGTDPDNVANTDKLGRFTWKMDVDFSQERKCNIEGILKGYVSTRIEVPFLTTFSDPHLSPLVLKTKGENADVEILDDARVPDLVHDLWMQAQKSIAHNQLAEADLRLKQVVKRAPKFARGWDALGMVEEHESKTADAAGSYHKSVEADPKFLEAYVALGRLDLELKNWEDADRVMSELVARDMPARYPEARLIQAIARIQLKNVDGAMASASDTIRLDAKLHKFPSAEYVLALGLIAKKDYSGANDHVKRYLAMLPARSPDLETVREVSAKLDQAIASGTQTTVVVPEAPDAGLGLAELPGAGVPGEAWVPGGRKALAEVVGLKDASNYQDFFTEYCRALAREMTVGTSRGIPDYLATVRTYMATVTDLLPLGSREGDITRFHLSLSNEPQRKMAEQILALLGWKIVSKDGKFSVEPGDQPADGPRQHIPKLFGIDEIAMQEALESGKSFDFEIPTENARLVGGNSWAPIIKQLPEIPGGIAAAFTQDVRLARAYAGLGAMGQDAAADVLGSVGVSDVVLQYADILARYGEALSVVPDGAKEMVSLPGGTAAESAWRKVVGANPHDPPAFFRALIGKGDGRLLAFYHTVWSADQAHQKYLTASEARVEKFYAFYRDSPEFKFGMTRHIDGWATDLLLKLPLEAGKARLPGGRAAWTQSTAPDEDALLNLKTLEALVPVAQLEERRKTPLDQASVALLAAHYAEWKSLLPYFQKLPALGHDEFASLQAFASAIAKQPQPRQNQVMGEWYSLVELEARGVEAGSLDGPKSALAFRNTCQGLSGDDHVSKALGILRDIAPGPNLTQAVADLLRLSPDRRAAFQKVLELQNVPRVDLNAPSPDPAKVVAALSGYVYAASVDPDALLISEDQRLLSRHQFVAADSASKLPFVFAPAALVESNTPPGSFLKGGFGNFDEIARSLANGGRSVPPISIKTDAKPEPAKSPDDPSLPLLASTEIAGGDLVFRTSSRLVEAYATVTDSRGRYVDDLTADQFTLLDGQQARPLAGFESHAQPVSVALLLDTTGSMALALPALKNAALKLIGELRSEDSVAVYSFNRSVTELQPFTTDLDSAKRAVLSTQALGETALYDALARVARDLSGRAGKKVIVVFTDGDDNSSTLTTDTAILRAKATGVPLFTIAEGDALSNRNYLAQLEDLSKATGGEAFAIKDSSEIEAVFAKVSEDLAHGYLLEFEPPSGDDRAWHPISIQVKARGDKVIRAREGYYPQ